MEHLITQIIQAVGLFGILAIVFAESGLFFGFFLPGDSLLVTAGLLASQGLLPFWSLILFTPIAAILGDSVGYWFGKKVGKRIFSREKSLLFNPQHIDRAEAFYLKYGKKTIVIARFVPIVRTFAPIVAGAANMHYDTFLKYNILGGLLWTLSMILFGYFVGNVIPDVDKYLLPIIGIIVLASLIPAVFEHYKSKKEKEEEN